LPSRPLVDPELLPLIEQMPGFQLSTEMLAPTRAMMAQMMALNAPALPAGVRRDERLIPGPAGGPDVRVVIIGPAAEASNRPAILHIHGGGYVMGSPDMVIANAAAWALALGAVTVSVDYRLAPETPFPGPVEDCYAALTWLNANAGALGIDAKRIAIVGESAGGGLAAATCLIARDRGEVSVAHQHLIFPMLDDRTAIDPDPSPYLGQFLWTRDANMFGWTALLGHAPGGDDVSPYAAPARARDLSGLPPTYIICGALDLFLEEDMDYAKRLIRAGVPTELHIYPGAPHGFMFVAEAKVSRTFARDSLAALQKALSS
jgi:acetyl esterase/lipase